MSKQQMEIVIEALRMYAADKRRARASWTENERAWNASTANEADDISRQLSRDLIR